MLRNGIEIDIYKSGLLKLDGNVGLIIHCALGVACTLSIGLYFQRLISHPLVSEKGIKLRVHH